MANANEFNNPHGTWYNWKPECPTKVRDIYERWASETAVISARQLDFLSRKDGVERIFEADSIKDLLRWVPTLLHRIADLERREEACLAALKPFAERCDRISEQVLWREADDDMQVLGTEAVTLGELRAASAAFAEASNG